LERSHGRGGKDWRADKEARGIPGVGQPIKNAYLLSGALAQIRARTKKRPISFTKKNPLRDIDFADEGIKTDSFTSYLEEQEGPDEKTGGITNYSFERGSENKMSDDGRILYPGQCFRNIAGAQTRPQSVGH